MWALSGTGLWCRKCGTRSRGALFDLADGRQFIVEFAARIKDQAVRAGRVAISGASTLPALSSAVVDELRLGLSSLESIEVIIAPGQRAPRGKATLEAVFSYLGRPFQVWREGHWRRAWGWMESQETRLDVGRRLASACDVPDLELFPSHYAGVQTVSFHAALEFGAQNLALWALAALRRIGLPFPVARWAVSLNRLAGMFDAAQARRAECESVLWEIGATAEAACGALGNSPHQQWMVLKFLAWRRIFSRVA